MPGGGPQRAFASPCAVVFVEHPPAHDRVAELDAAGMQRALLEMVLLAADAT
jgi:hypothetical protein